MTDLFALFIVMLGIVVLIIVKVTNRGEYEEQFFLSAGTYLVGRDIDPGKGDLKAVSGAGTFCVRNKQTKNWDIYNPIGVTSGLQPSRFRNLTLKKDDILEINGTVVVAIIPPNPICDLEEETLGPGTYRFGVDVPVGKYDLEIASGEGHVLLAVVGKDNYTFFQDMAASDPIRAASYKNVVCTTGHELWVNGSLQIKLAPSEHQPGFLSKFISKFIDP